MTKHDEEVAPLYASAEAEEAYIKAETEYQMQQLREETARRREYVEAECEQAGLTSGQTELAISAAMSAAEELDADTFEQMVEDIVNGVAADYEV